ncbi:MAG: hypothetical protein ABSD29_13655 [Verrucomicrobiota bacterium]|jgi:hypothetical protein
MIFRYSPDLAQPTWTQSGVDAGTGTFTVASGPPAGDYIIQAAYCDASGNVLSYWSASQEVSTGG